MFNEMKQNFISKFSKRSKEVFEFQSAFFNEAEKLGWPSRRMESWKYSALPTQTSEFQESDSFQEMMAPYEVRGLKKIVFIDGVLNLQVSDKVAGVNIVSLDQAIDKNFNQVKKWIEEMPRPSRLDDRVFYNLNTAFLEKGAILEIGLESEPVQIFHISTKTSANDFNFTRLILSLKRSANAKIALFELGHASSSVVTSVYQEANSSLELLRFSHNSQLQVNQTDALLERDSQSKLFNIALTPGMSRLVTNVYLQGSGAQAQLLGLNLLAAKQVSDNQTNVEHLVPNATSRQIFKSIQAEQSRSVYSGRVYIAPGAQGSDSDQLSKSLVLSRQSEADAKPQLEVFADDVKATHGAAIGRMDDEELFYLQSRGIPKKEALGILANAFVEDILLNIQNEELRGLLRELAFKEFSKFPSEELYNV